MTEALPLDPVMNLVYQSLARNLSMALSAHLRYDLAFAVDANSGASRPVRSNPACLAVFRVDPGNLPVVLDLPLPFAKWLVELILGGQPTENADEEPSELTEIEIRLLAEVFEIIAVELTASVARLGNFQVRTDRVETEVEMLRAFAPGDRVVNVNLTASLGNETFKINVQQSVLPYGSEETVPQSDAAAPDNQFLDLLAMVEVDFETRL